MAERNPGQSDQQEHFFGAAKVVAGVTVLSRVLGLVREAAITALGATAQMGAFRVAFSIPNLFRRLFGEGAMSASFVPVFTEVLTGGEDREPREVMANTAGWLGLLLAGVVAVIEIALGAWLLAGSPDDQRALLLRLVMIVLPFMFTVCMLALGAAALNCRGHFFFPAFAPVLLNVFMIAAALASLVLGLGDSPRALWLLSGSVVVAGVVQLLGVALLLRRMELLARPTLRPLLGPVRRVAALAIPMILPMGVLQFSAFFDRFYAYVMAATAESPVLHLGGWALDKPLAEGVVTSFDNASRLYQLPLGVLAVSLGTAVFPLFSRYAAAGDLPGLRSAANRALRLSFFMGIPAGAALILMSEEIVTVLFLRGRYTPVDAARSAYILRMYCLGMWAFFANHILLRAFFSQKDTTTPLKVSCALAGVNIVLVVSLVFSPLREGALGLATALTASATTLALTWILHRRWGRIGFRRILASLGRTAACTVAMGGVIFLAVRLLGPAAGEVSMAASGAAVAVGVVGGTGAYLTVARMLKCPELGELVGAMRRRGGRGGGEGV